MKRVLWENLRAYLALGVLLVSACSTPKVQTAQKPTVPVTVATAVQRNVPVQLRPIGNVEAYSTISVKAQIGGDLIRVYFTEGQDVKKGSTLFQIDPRPYEQQVKQVEAALAKDLAQIRQAEANLARDTAQFKNADVQAGRYSKLVAEGVISKEQNDQIRTNADALQEAIRADQAAIESARAAVNSDQANLERAKLDLSYCSIRSPIDGRTGNLLVKEGNLVKANADTPLVVINQVIPVYVTFSVPEQYLTDIRKYMAMKPLAVDAIVDKNENQSVRGVLTFIDNSVDAATGTIKLKATFPNREKKLWPGQFVNVVLTLSTQSGVTVVPSEAIQTGQKGQYAFVVKPDNTVENRAVVLGRSIDRLVVVERGITPGEKVVTDGQLRLVPGAAVQIVSSPQTAEESSQ
jgi:multidrug efflux system membrane fusion protein